MKISQGKASNTLQNIDKSSLLFSAISLICGAMIIAGVFMPWFHIAQSVWVVNLSYSASGWEMAAGNSLLLTAFTYYSGESFPQAYYVLTGGALLIAISIVFLMINFLDKGHFRLSSMVNNIATTFAALLSFGTAIWFITYIIVLHDHLIDSGISVDSFGFGYGIYVTAAFSFMALIAGIASIANGIRKRYREDSSKI